MNYEKPGADADEDMLDTSSLKKVMPRDDASDWDFGAVESEGEPEEDEYSESGNAVNPNELAAQASVRNKGTMTAAKKIPKTATKAAEPARKKRAEPVRKRGKALKSLPQEASPDQVSEQDPVQNAKAKKAAAAAADSGTVVVQSAALQKKQNNKPPKPVLMLKTALQMPQSSAEATVATPAKQVAFVEEVQVSIIDSMVPHGISKLDLSDASLSSAQLGTTSGQPDANDEPKQTIQTTNPSSPTVHSDNTTQSSLPTDKTALRAHPQPQPRSKTHDKANKGQQPTTARPVEKVIFLDSGEEFLSISLEHEMSELDSRIKESTTKPSRIMPGTFALFAEDFTPPASVL